MLQAVPVPGGAALPRVPALLAGVRRPALPRPQAGGVAVPRSDHARRQGRGRACRLQGKEGRGDFTLYLHVFGKNVYWKKNSQGHLSCCWKKRHSFFCSGQGNDLLIIFLFI